jgi:monoamine oxidase
LVDEAWWQLKKLYGIDHTRHAPLYGAYLNWGADRWGGAAVHFWSIGANPGEIIKLLQEPVPGLHICNEAWSRDQGWLEGAVGAADELLQQKFELGAYA